MAFEFIELSKQALDNLTDEEHLALKVLSQDKTIVISKADKGNAVVIQDMETYRSKILELLQQDSKFNKIPKPKIPKIHKANCPLRPIISAVGNYNYKLAKWLVEIFSPLLDNNKYILKDTFDFVNKVSKLNTIIDKSMLSFDVESLFTNIPILETIDIILKRIYSNEISCA
jgi:hypothetical protein